MKNDGRVSASEIGEFVYCKRAWWLRYKGLLKTTDLMTSGTQKHTAQFLNVEKIQIGRLLAFGFLLTGAIILIVFFLLQNLF